MANQFSCKVELFDGVYIKKSLIYNSQKLLMYSLNFSKKELYVKKKIGMHCIVEYILHCREINNNNKLNCKNKIITNYDYCNSNWTRAFGSANR